MENGTELQRLLEDRRRIMSTNVLDRGQSEASDFLFIGPLGKAELEQRASARIWGVQNNSANMMALARQAAAQPEQSSREDITGRVVRRIAGPAIGIILGLILLTGGMVALADRAEIMHPLEVLLFFVFFLVPGFMLLGLSSLAAWHRSRKLRREYRWREIGQTARAQFGEALHEEERRASYALTAVVRRWQELAHNKWVGTALEEDYFHGSPRLEAVRLLDAVNMNMERAGSVTKQLQVPVSRVGAEQRIQEIMQADLITIELEKLLSKVLS